VSELTRRALTLGIAFPLLFSLRLAAAKITEFPLPANSLPTSIALGFDGNMWFTEPGTDKIAAITPAGTIFQFAAPTAGCMPYGITRSPHDGRLWFTCGNKARLGIVGPGPVIVDTPIAAIPVGPIAAGADGNLWLETIDGFLRAFRVNGTQIYAENVGSPLLGAATGGDGEIWLTAPDDDVLVHVKLVAGVFQHGVTPNATGRPTAIAWCAQSGSVWYAEENFGNLGHFSPLRDLAPHDVGLLAGADSQPKGVACGADGSVWYTAAAGNEVGRLKQDGVTIEAFDVPTVGGHPFAIAVGLDGSVWFTELFGSKIGRLQLRPGGEVTGDGVVDVSDVFYLINFLFAGGPVPVP
jgi:virginiamycin B lyase